MITIIQPGPQCTVQDLGRGGLRKFGVGVSGALDTLSLRIANMMLANDPNAAGLEVTLGGAELRFDQDTRFALTGADMAATLDGLPVPPWWARTAPAGSVLKLGMPRAGMRSYLAFEGGIDVPVVIGSRSTDMKGGFGGLDGRALKAGDRIAVAGVLTSLKTGSGTGFGLAAAKLGLVPADRSMPTTVRFVAAAEWNEIEPALQGSFVDAAWRIQPESNRVGYRLAGPVLATRRPLELLSHGILPGTIQLPPSGQPMVQMGDANTCGGYPKLGVVISADLPKLAQASLGSSVRFQQCSAEDGIRAMGEAEALLQGIAMHIRLADRVLA